MITTDIVADAVEASNVIPSSCSEYSGMVFGMPTASRVPVNSEAGMVPDTVSGVVNVVATETQLFPFQYSITLESVKLGFVMLMVEETSEPKAPLLEVTLTS